jgi:PPM family protein phosphatase
MPRATFAWAVRIRACAGAATRTATARADLGLYVVADGMGGHVAGRGGLAGGRHGHRGVHRRDGRAPTHRTWPFPFEPALSLDGNRLKAAFRLANRRIAEAIAGASDLRGMATTASALLAGREGACVAHVGDSRVYVLRNGRLEQVTHDHSWVGGAGAGRAP